MKDNDISVHPDDNDIAAWIEKSLSVNRLATVERHLANCPECRELLAVYSKAETSVRIEHNDGRARIRFQHWFAVAAILLAALSIFIFLITRQSGIVKPPVQTKEQQREKQPDLLTPPQQNESDPEQIAELDAPKDLPESDESLLHKRGSQKRIGDKTFRFRNGVWIDIEFENSRDSSIVELSRKSQEYQQLIQKHPDLKEFFAAGNTVIVVLEGKAYKLVED